MSGTVRLERPAGLGKRVLHQTPESLSESVSVRLAARDVERLNALAASRRVEVSVLVREGLRFFLTFAEAEDR